MSCCYIRNNFRNEERAKSWTFFGMKEILSYLIRDSRGKGGSLYDAEFCGFAEHVRDVLHVHLGIYALAVGVDCVD